MGTGYLFKCPSCDYSAVVSGGDAVGMACRKTTIICETCEELLDIVISDKPWEPQEPGDVTLVCRGTEGGHENPDHEVRRWTAPGPCPKCGATIASGEEYLNWD